MACLRPTSGLVVFLIQENSVRCIIYRCCKENSGLCQKKFVCKTEPGSVGDEKAQNGHKSGRLLVSKKGKTNQKRMNDIM